MMMPKRFVFIGLAIVFLLAFRAFSDRADQDNGLPKSDSSGTLDLKNFDKTRFSLTDPASIWVVVNKKRPLSPKEYVPGDLKTPQVALRLAADNNGSKLRREAAGALQDLFKAAEAHGTPLRLSSGYRSYNYQVSLYNGYVQKEGQGTADSESARPGYSEHQTGLAVDVGNLDGHCEVEQCFGDSAAGKWVAANSYKYGYIVRYPAGLTDITGYEYEPWHLRYVGTYLATAMHDSGAQTLEQFFNLGSAPDY